MDLIHSSIVALAALAVAPAGAWSQAPDSARAPAHAATLFGRVHDPGGVGISLVRISANTASRPSAVTDTAGHFALRGLDTGQVGFTVRRIGFDPAEFSVTLDADEPFTLDLTLTQSVVTLAEVDVTAESRVRAGLPMFYRHREASVGGVFITRADIEKRQAHRLSDVLQTVPGVQILPSRGAGQDAVRMARAVGGHDCPVTIWVDGQRVPGLNVDDIGPGDVEAVEIYKGAASLPAEYNVNRGTPACGTIAIWTRVPGA